MRRRFHESDELDAALRALGQGGPDDLRERLDEAKKLLAWAAELERIRLDRWAIVDGKFSDTAAAPRYGESFAAPGWAGGEADPDELAARVQASPIRRVLVNALDDW